jgi:hydrogenase maturation factor
MDQGERLVEGKVLEVFEQEGHPCARVSVRGVRWVVRTDLVPEVEPGDRILFQGRIALARVEEAGS